MLILSSDVDRPSSHFQALSLTESAYVSMLSALFILLTLQVSCRMNSIDKCKVIPLIIVPAVQNTHMTHLAWRGSENTIVADSMRYLISGDFLLSRRPADRTIRPSICLSWKPSMEKHAQNMKSGLSRQVACQHRFGYPVEPMLQTTCIPFTQYYVPYSQD